jgi:hypothetical protein
MEFDDGSEPFSVDGRMAREARAFDRGIYCSAT